MTAVPGGDALAPRPAPRHLLVAGGGELRPPGGQFDRGRAGGLLPRVPCLPGMNTVTGVPLFSAFTWSTATRRLLVLTPWSPAVPGSGPAWSLCSPPGRLRTCAAPVPAAPGTRPAPVSWSPPRAVRPRSLIQACAELDPDPADRVQVAGLLCGFAELAAQPGHVDVDGLVRAAVGHPPDMGQQIPPGHHLAALQRQVVQQVELAPAQVQPCPPSRVASCPVRIELQAADHERAGVGPPPRGRPRGAAPPGSGCRSGPARTA